MLKKLANYFTRKTRSLLGTTKINLIEYRIARIEEVLENVSIDSYLKENLFENNKYIKSKRLAHYHNSVFTQNGEDGIVEEIFTRIGTTNKFFVEFGVHGVKNNSTFLLIKEWKGVWIGGSSAAEQNIKIKFKQHIKSKQLNFRKAWITKDNIEELFSQLNIPSELDYLSIDLDGNDYWIWEAIKSYSPRAISIEYNATIPPDTSWVMRYDENHVWDQTSYFGASLKALEILGKQEGYHLVGCDFTGCNAFFVRKDLILDLFQEPFTAEFHYEPARYFLKKASGHVQGFGPFEMIE